MPGDLCSFHLKKDLKKDKKTIIGQTIVTNKIIPMELRPFEVKCKESHRLQSVASYEPKARHLSSLLL